MTATAPEVALLLRVLAVASRAAAPGSTDAELVIRLVGALLEDLSVLLIRQTPPIESLKLESYEQTARRLLGQEFKPS